MAARLYEIRKFAEIKQKQDILTKETSRKRRRLFCHDNGSIGRRYRERGMKMGENTIYYISEAAKKVQVEAHVLRYWEDELKLRIKRNEMGHRCYSQEDIERLQQIKLLKEQGLQLKAIRTVLFENGAAETKSDAENVVKINNGGNMDVMEDVTNMEQKVEDMVMKKAQKYMVTLSKGKEPIIETPREKVSEYNVQEEMDKTQKAARLQYLLHHMITEAVKSANQEMCTEIKESILKELDYQFRQQEERDEEHWKQEEEHYRKIDEMIRQRHLPKEKLPKGKRKSPINLG